MYKNREAMENFDKIKTLYFKRSYFALDGLWFVMVEKHFSLKKALKIDEDVWRVLPKIQVRQVKKLLNLNEDNLQNFIRGIKVKLEAEDYQYEIKLKNGEDLTLLIKKCPWFEIIKRSQREYVLPNDICQIDFQTWADEFQLNLKVKILSCMCWKDKNCKICFVSKDKI